MTHHTQLDDKLGGVEKFRAWKYINEEFPDPEGDEANAIHKKNLITSSLMCHH